mgnify:FL=1
MMNFIMVPLIFGIVTYGIYSLFELFVHKKERLMIIEKLSEKVDWAVLDGKLQLPSFAQKRISFSALKIGCLMLGLGLGLLVGFIFHTYVKVNFGGDWDMVSVAYGASVLLCGGLGLILAFIIENKMGKKDDE